MVIGATIKKKGGWKMRDLKEVWEFVKKEDVLGITLGDVLEFMDWKTVKEMEILKEEYVEKVEKGEEEWKSIPYTPENVIKRMKDYMEFAWDKANGCRGISAWRSIQHYRNWLYMFGDGDIDEMVRAMEHYEYYGKPWLSIICEILGIDWTKLDNGLWVNYEDNIGISEEQILKTIEEYKSKIPFERIKEKFEKIEKAKGA